MAFPTITRTTWTDAPPDSSATVINNAALQAIYDKIDNLVTRIVTVRKNSTGTQINQGMLNFIEGSNVTLTIAEDTSNKEIDITIAAAGLTADEVWDEATSGHSSSGTTGKALTDVLADTNSLQGEWANGGRLDLLLDKADTQSAAFVDESYDIQLTTITGNLAGTTTTDLVSVTETGKLISLSCIVETAPSGTNPDNQLELTVDGGTQRNMAMWNGATTWGVSEVRGYAAIGDGSNVNDRFVLNFNTRYKTSLLIGFDRLTGASSGQCRFTVLRGVKL